MKYKDTSYLQPKQRFPDRADALRGELLLGVLEPVRDGEAEDAILAWVERFDRRGTEPFEPLEPLEPIEFFQNSGIFPRKFNKNQKNSTLNFSIFWRNFLNFFF